MRDHCSLSHRTSKPPLDINNIFFFFFTCDVLAFTDYTISIWNRLFNIIFIIIIIALNLEARRLGFKHCTTTRNRRDSLAFTRSA
jgi:hypothetical protein